jgi:hypothetical protein
MDVSAKALASIAELPPLQSYNYSLQYGGPSPGIILLSEKIIKSKDSWQMADPVGSAPFYRVNDLQ